MKNEEWEARLAKMTRAELRGEIDYLVAERRKMRRKITHLQHGNVNKNRAIQELQGDRLMNGTQRELLQLERDQAQRDRDIAEARANASGNAIFAFTKVGQLGEKALRELVAEKRQG